MGTKQITELTGIEKKREAAEIQSRSLLSTGDVEETLRIVLETGCSPYSASSIQMQGMLALRKGRFADADRIIQQAIGIKRSDPLGWKMAGDSAYLQCKYSDAEQNYRKALQMRPDWHECEHDLGVAVVSQGRVQECLQHFQRAIDLAPERADYYHHMAIMLVLSGQDAAGWDRMQWRMRVPGVCGTFPHPEKYWQGEPLQGKTIVVRTEQGWGDTIMFASYLPWLAERAARVYFFCQRAMLRWAQVNFPYVEVWPNDAPPPLDFDYHVNIMCLPRLTPTEAYRAPAPREGRGKGLGVCWFGSPTHKADHLRSVPIERFDAIAKAFGDKLYCLGYGRFDSKPPFIEYLIDRCHDWQDTAQIVRGLDLVVTVDTAIAHLAGFLGVETWLLLPYVCDFRWGMTQERTKWYPSMKLYRQPKLFDWDSVFARVSEDVRARFSS